MSVNDITFSGKRLSLDEQLELGKRMTEYGDQAAREKLVLSCIPLVKSFYKTPLCHYFSCYDDVFQDGMTGVLEAVDLYDYTRKTSFITFAYIYIHKRIVKGVIARAPLKISDQDFFNSILLRSTSDSFYAAHQVSPTTEQLSKLTNISESNVELLLRRSIVNPYLFKSNDVQEELVLPKTDTNLTVEKTLKKLLQEKIIEEALDTLGDAEKDIIQQRYLYTDRKVPLKELADKYNISMPAICKKEKAAIKKLFTFFVGKNISLEDVI